MANFNDLSENELQTVIENAKNELKARQENKRKEVLAQIKSLAASINVHVEIHEGDKRSARKGIKVPVKYQNPENPEEKWTGRGVTPKWLQAYLEAGRDKSEFEI
jgi:DNA-binding protein H-NS